MVLIEQGVVGAAALGSHHGPLSQLVVVPGYACLEAQVRDCWGLHGTHQGPLLE